METGFPPSHEGQAMRKAGAWCCFQATVLAHGCGQELEWRSPLGPEGGFTVHPGAPGPWEGWKLLAAAC